MRARIHTHTHTHTHKTFIHFVIKFLVQLYGNHIQGIQIEVTKLIPICFSKLRKKYTPVKLFATCKIEM